MLFSEDRTLNIASFDLDPKWSSSTFEYQSCAQKLYGVASEILEILGFWFWVMNFYSQLPGFAPFDMLLSFGV
jgi:hypothetical protein